MIRIEEELVVNNKTIDARVLSRMFLAGAKNLEAKKEWINELNVFPVPDGDTGTNMTMTIMAAAAEVGSLGETDMETLAKAISSGSLRGARGNSGVILSQLLRGFTKSVQKSENLEAAAIAAAMEKGVETAYKAVMKPKEGTILTVAKEAAAKAVELAETAEDLDTFFQAVIAHAEETLARTPEMLPVLKEAGVVDSGGQGLVEVFHGAYDGYLGKEVDYTQFSGSKGPAVTKIDAQTEKDIKFGYCTEFIILLDKPMPEETEHEFKKFLMSIGDSIVLVADDEIVKVHVHTNHPGLADVYKRQEYAFQVFLTIGGATKFIPMTGVTLPLVSYGGSSVASTVLMLAIIQGLYILREDEDEEIERQRRKEAAQRAGKTAEAQGSGNF